MTFPESVKKIGYKAFEDCIGLQGILINSTDMITIGNDAFSGCDTLRFVASNALEGIFEDDYTPYISDNYSYYSCRGDHDSITIGEGSNIQDGCILHADAGFPVVIGDHVTVGHAAIIHGCEIGDGALIGMGSIVLNGAKIGKNAIIGAGALVTQGTVIPDGMLAVGSPAKVRREVTVEEIKQNHEDALDYIETARAQFGDVQ